MNEKVAKKVGEAYAFAQVLSETFTRNKEVMSEILGDHAVNLDAVVNTQQDDLKKIAEHHGFADVVLPKAERTGEKITKMGEMYVGDDWDDAAEVLEWMSFFVGGAIVHWQLITGSAEDIQDDDFMSSAGVGTQYYLDLMNRLKEYAVIIGKQRVHE